MTLRQFNIAVLPGDGIGTEVTAQAVRILNEIKSRLDGVWLNLTEYSVGVAEYLSSGNALPDSAFDACRTSDAILLGAMGLPSVRYPDGREIVPQIDIRERLDLYGGVRPVRLYHDNDTPLKNYSAGDIDFVLVRESTEGLFSRRNALPAADADEVCDTMTITRRKAERVCRLAFNIARTRRRHVTLVDKANVLSSMVFFRRIFDEVAAEFPDCNTDRVYVDAAALLLIRDPRRFDVLVTENMFGDILSDLAAGLVGGLGMAPSADIGDHTAVFQPVHGSAPDIAGKGLANPVAMLLSTAMMLEWLPHDETKRAGKAVRDAVVQVLNDPALRTADMGGTLTTTQMTDAVYEALKRTIGG